MVKATSQEILDSANRIKKQEAEDKEAGLLEIKIENTRNKCESTNRENTFMRGFLSGLEYSLECTESELYLIELNKGGK